MSHELLLFGLAIVILANAGIIAFVLGSRPAGSTERLAPRPAPTGGSGSRVRVGPDREAIGIPSAAEPATRGGDPLGSECPAEDRPTSA